MKTAAAAFVLALAFAPVGYVRREWRSPACLTCVVDGSRDRRLHGKARRRARRTNQPSKET